jgi:hypothetical protein
LDHVAGKFWGRSLPNAEAAGKIGMGSIYSFSSE